MIEDKRLPFVWIIISIAVLSADYATGPSVQFPIAFALPVILASWYSGRTWGVFLAVLLPAVRVVFHHYWETPTQELVEAVNLVIRIAVLWGMAYLVDRTATLSREVKVLRGILQICSNCKKIHAESGAWKQMESYISDHSEADFSHGLCPECAGKLYPQYFREDGPK